MKVLLINPPLQPTSRYGKRLGRVGGVSEPLGLAYIAEVVRENRKEDVVAILDALAQRMSVREVVDFIISHKFDLIGITMFTTAYGIVAEIIRTVKQINPNIITVVGGYHPSVLPIETMRDVPEIDYTIKSEGEFAFLELLNVLEGRGKIDEIKGLIFRNDGHIIMNKNREYIGNLDILPLPARDLLPMKYYRPAASYYHKLPAYGLISSRGCPFRCIYCPKILGSSYRIHSSQRIIDELEMLIRDYKAKEIIFWDSIFAIHRKHGEEICDKIVEAGLNKYITWTVFSRVDCVDEGILDKMYKAGCRRIRYGVESGNQRLLDIINKNITLEQVKKIFSVSRKIGFDVTAYFILGLPTETREESFQTIQFAKGLDTDWVQFTLAVPYPGAPLYKLAKENGDLISENWGDYQTWASWAGKDLVYVPKGRTMEELKELQIRSMREFYFRFKVIFRLLRRTKSWASLKKYLFGGYAILLGRLKSIPLKLKGMHKKR